MLAIIVFLMMMDAVQKGQYFVGFCCFIGFLSVAIGGFGGSWSRW